MIPSRNVKAATQIDATQRIHYSYNGYYYDFIPNDSIPSNYVFNSDVIEYVINKGANAINSYQTQRFGTVTNAIVNRVADVIYSLMRNVAIGAGKINYQYIDSNACIYYWNYECTGIDPDYEFSTEYGPAYGFKFVGLCDEIFTLVLDQNGGFYGSQKIGNWTYTTSTSELINQIAPQYDPNTQVINVPYGTLLNFYDLKQPYFKGTSLYFYLYDGNNVEHECHLDNFARCAMVSSPRLFGSNNGQYIAFIDSKIPINERGPRDFYIDNVATELRYATVSFSFNYNNSYYSGVLYGYQLDREGISWQWPSHLGPSNNTLPHFDYSSYDCSGVYNNSFISGSGASLWLDTISTTPTETPANPSPAPINVPIPVTEIPDDPEDPIPQNPTPDPVPGVPINPTPIPLPPFVSIVSGNDDLWGNTIDYENVQEGLLPYISGLSEFTFPSFTDLISDFSGSLIWVTQLMSVLYNGTGYNILFICLCLFSLVSVLIGAYKLWNTTEPDPNMPGFRRTKRPPKQNKGGKRN